MKIIHRIDKIEYKDFLKSIDFISESFSDISLNKVDLKNRKRFCIGHNIGNDVDFSRCIDFAIIEKKLNIKSTYFFLHTSAFFNYSPDIIDICKYLIDMGHEIGICNNALTAYYMFNKSKSFKRILEEPIEFFRRNGIEIKGSSSIINTDMYPGMIYNNYEIWSEYSKNKNEGFSKLDFDRISLKSLDLLYETHFLEYDYYLSDYGFKWTGFIVNKGRPVPTERTIFNTKKDAGISIIPSYNSRVNGGLLLISISPCRNWWVVY